MTLKFFLNIFLFKHIYHMIKVRIWKVFNLIIASDHSFLKISSSLNTFLSWISVYFFHVSRSLQWALRFCWLIYRELSSVLVSFYAVLE